MPEIKNPFMKFSRRSKKKTFFHTSAPQKYSKSPLNTLCSYWHNKCDCWSLMSTFVDATQNFLIHFQFKNLLSHCKRKSETSKGILSWKGSLRRFRFFFCFFFAYENSRGISTIQFCILMQCKHRAHTSLRLKICSCVAIEILESF